MSDYYDRDGMPITNNLWAKLLENSDYKRVAFDKGDNGEKVSTVWLGLDHSFDDGDGPPMIFETMVFDSEGEDEYTERYSTEDEALAGHAAILARYRATNDAPWWR